MTKKEKNPNVIDLHKNRTTPVHLTGMFGEIIPEEIVSGAADFAARNTDLGKLIIELHQAGKICAVSRTLTLYTVGTMFPRPGHAISVHTRAFIMQQISDKGFDDLCYHETALWIPMPSTRRKRIRALNPATLWRALVNVKQNTYWINPDLWPILVCLLAACRIEYEHTSKL